MVVVAQNIINDTLRDSATPDGKIVMKKEKKIYLIEQTIPWITNRDEKFDFKAQVWRRSNFFEARKSRLCNRSNYTSRGCFQRLQ